MTAGSAPLALFDLDNTLLDRARGFRSWARSFLRSCGVDVPGAVAWFADADNDGRTSPEDLLELAALRFGIAIPVDELLARHRAEYPTHPRLDDDLAVALRLLRGAGWRIAVVADGADDPDRAEIDERTITRSGIGALVDGWAVGGRDGARKPDRALFALAAARAGAPLEVPREVWVVGDDPVGDIGAGHDLGATTVWIHRERTWPLTAYRPAAMVTSVPEAVTSMLDPEVHLPAAFR